MGTFNIPALADHEGGLETVRSESANSPETTAGGDPFVAESLGERIRRLRKEARLSLKMVAATIGVSHVAVFRWEQDKAIASSAFVVPLARILGVSMDELLEGSSSKHSASQIPLNPHLDNLSHVIEECKEQIARAAGTSAAQIKIVIEI